MNSFMKSFFQAAGFTAILILLTLNPVQAQSGTAIDLVVSLDSGDPNFNYYFNFTLTDASGQTIFRTRDREQYVNHPAAGWYSTDQYGSIRLSPGTYRITFEVYTNRHYYQSRTDSIVIESDTLYGDGFYYVEFSEGNGFYWREVFFEDGNGNQIHFQ